MDLQAFQNLVNRNAEQQYCSMLLKQNQLLYDELIQALMMNKNIGFPIPGFPSLSLPLQQEVSRPLSSGYKAIESRESDEKQEKTSISSTNQSIKNNEKCLKVNYSSNKVEKTCKNDTKNIPKNFGSAICTFIKKSDGKVRKLLHRRGVSLPLFMRFNNRMKDEIQSISDLRNAWSFENEDPEREYKICYRILSHDFIRRYSLGHIFESRIKNVPAHIKYRCKLLEALKKPSELTNLKDF